MYQQRRPKKYRKKPVKRYNGGKYQRASKNEIMYSRMSGTIENKVTQTLYQNTVSTTGLVYDLLGAMTPGTGALSNYIGKEILPTSIRVNLSVTMGPTAGLGDGTNIIRVIVFQWMDTVVPTVGGILVTSTLPQSQFNWDNIENITVLADRMYAVSQDTAAAGYDAMCDKIYVKGKKMTPVKYNSATNAVQKGALYCLVLTDSNATPSPYVTLSNQVTYTDS